MIFEIICDEDGDICLNTYTDRDDWVTQERKEIEGTILEQDSKKYLEQFIRGLQEDNISLDEYVGKILIEGKIIIPKIKSTINVLDL